MALTAPASGTNRAVGPNEWEEQPANTAMAAGITATMSRAKGVVAAAFRNERSAGFYAGLPPLLRHRGNSPLLGRSQCALPRTAVPGIVGSTILGAAVTSFAALFPIVNPLGGLALFFALTDGDTDEQRRAYALRIALYVIAILLAFAIGGSWVLEFFGISLGALRIAGGLIVAHTAWAMVTASSRTTPAERAEAAQKDDISFTPMAMPMLAGPGSIGVVMALAARPEPSSWMVGIGLAVVAMGVLIYALLRLGGPVARRMGPGVMGAIDRILGFLILAIAIELIISGFKGVYPKFGI